MRHASRIVSTLAAHAAVLEEQGTGRWAAVLQNGTRLAATATVDDGWLVLDALVDGARGELPDVRAGAAASDRLWALLRAHGGLGGAVRFVVRRRAGALRLALRADVPLDDEVDVGGRVHEACAALHEAGSVVMGAATGEAASPPAPVDVGALVRATRWPAVERASGRLAVELEVPGVFRQAVVEARPDGRVSASLPVASADDDDAPPAPPCRAALGLLLLRAGSVVRLVRAATDEAAVARYEVVLGDAPAVVELQHALAALSMVARLTLREAAVLRADAGVAAAYLARVGGDAAPKTNNPGFADPGRARSCEAATQGG